ncbi:MAG TPA: ATP-binding protein [Jatrophihabitans sp.]|nr:ATP-binding protein [Jatrophihabitans sp.]
MAVSSDRGAAGPAAQASSLDGRTFTGGLPADSELVIGDLVVLETPDGTRLLGQLLDKHGERDRISCTGSVLGRAGGSDGSRPRPFAQATVTAAPPDVVEALQERTGATMPIGAIRSNTPGLVARLRPAGFNRHTFLCGQSGSGKTYALGLILEQLFLDTELRVIIVDPNGDYVRLGEVRNDAAAGDAQRLQSVALRVLRPRDLGTESLRVRFATLAPETKAAILQIDPLADRAEYNALLHLLERGNIREAEAIAAHLAEGDEVDRALGQRVENLGVLTWDVWALDHPSATELLVADERRVTVLDVGGFRHPPEPLVTAIDLLDHLWENREQRRPTLIVIDEAHNVCSANPAGPIQAATTRRLIQIAGEGRKFGLWLLLSTQRPSKIHPNVLSQCDNLALMRMNSPGDLVELRDVFGFAPPSMLSASPSFRQGEMLVAGGFAPAPTFVQVGARRTHEGGSDVKVPMPTAE